MIVRRREIIARAWRFYSPRKHQLFEFAAIRLWLPACV
jgi:hypothetical protein